MCKFWKALLKEPQFGWNAIFWVLTFPRNLPLIYFWTTSPFEFFSSMIVALSRDMVRSLSKVAKCVWFYYLKWYLKVLLYSLVVTCGYVTRDWAPQIIFTLFLIIFLSNQNFYALNEFFLLTKKLVNKFIKIKSFVFIGNGRIKLKSEAFR